MLLLPSAGQKVRKKISDIACAIYNICYQKLLSRICYLSYHVLLLLVLSTRTIWGATKTCRIIRFASTAAQEPKIQPKPMWYRVLYILVVPLYVHCQKLIVAYLISVELQSDTIPVGYCKLLRAYACTVSSNRTGLKLSLLHSSL